MMVFTTGLGLDTLSVLGEKLIGQTSNAVGQLVTRSNSTTIEFVCLSKNKFTESLKVAAGIL